MSFRVDDQREETVGTLIAISVVLFYLVSSGFYLTVMFKDRKGLATAGLATLIVGLAVHVVALGSGVVDCGFSELFNIQRGLSVVALFLGSGFLAMRGFYRLALLGSFVVPLMTLLQCLAVVAEPGVTVGGELAGKLLILHIIAALLGTAAFVLAALISVLYLWQERSLKQKRFGRFFHKLPSVSVLDRANARLVSVGFPIHTVAIGLGAVWAWDHAQTLQVQYLFAMVSWFIYAAIIHARVAGGWRGRRAAWLTLLGLVGLAAVLSTYFVRSIIA